IIYITLFTIVKISDAWIMRYTILSISCRQGPLPSASHTLAFGGFPVLDLALIRVAARKSKSYCKFERLHPCIACGILVAILIVEVLSVTQILTCLTPDYIMQASDRRLTRTTNRRVEVFEDHSNKALIYRNHFAFAYTGRARLVLTSAIDWAAQRLSESKNLDGAISHLKDRATDLMNNFYSSHRPYEKMLAFVGAGFAEVQVNGRWNLRPTYIVISNFREQNGTWLEKPRKEFSIAVEPLAERRAFELLVAGQQLTRERREKLNKIIMRCLRHKEGPETIGRFLAREIQATA